MAETDNKLSYESRKQLSDSTVKIAHSEICGFAKLIIFIRNHMKEVNCRKVSYLPTGKTQQNIPDIMWTICYQDWV